MKEEISSQKLQFSKMNHKLSIIMMSKIHLIAPIFLLSLSFTPMIINCELQQQKQQQQQQMQNVSVSSTSTKINTATATTTNRENFQPFSNYIQGKKTEFSPINYDIAQDTQNISDYPQTLSSAMLRTYIRANNMRAYHLDLHSYRDGAKYVGDPSFVKSDSIEHKLRCSNHLNQYKQLLENFYKSDPILDENSLDSLRLADAFGRPEAGILSGNQFWLGSYDSCLDFSMKLKIEENDDDDENTGKNENVNGEIKAQYCLGITQFKNWNPKDSKTSLKIGLCLPETCTSSMLNEEAKLFSTVESMMKYQLSSSQPFKNLKLRQVYCLPHETSEIRKYSLSAMCFFIFVGTFASICLIATIIDYSSSTIPENLKQSNEQDKRNWKTVVVESFSLLKNLNKFLSIREETRTATSVVAEGSFNRDVFLNSQSGLKTISLALVVAAHCFLVGPITSNNILITDKLTKTYLADIYLTAHLLVDTFFALSGLLASYLLFKEGLDKMKTKHWLILTIHRYLRLTPIYLICYWFTKSVGFLINSGPLWDYMTAEQSPRLNCQRESWFEAIFHQSDFKSPKEHCVPFAWFIANGIKFWLVTPLFLTMIHKSMRKGYMVTLSVLMANMALVMTLAMKSNVDVKSVVEFKPESADNMLNNMGEVYTRPYSRIGAYLVGLLAGHLMYLIDTNQIEIKLSRNTKIFASTLCTTTVIILVFILKIASGMKLDDSALPWVFGISSAVIRPLWATCTCWFVFALAHGQASWLGKFLSARIWRILVKLSFCAYLAQGEVIAQIILSPSKPPDTTYFFLIAQPIVAVTLTLFVSFIMVLVLEYPLIGLEELFLPRHKKSNSAGIKDSIKPNIDANGAIDKTSEKLKIT